LLKAAKEHDPYTNSSKLVKKLKAVLHITSDDDFNIQTARGWAFPPLPECRRMWEARNGGAWPWHRDVRAWGGPQQRKVSDRPDRF
jgi:hypothetical protein